MWKEQGEHGSLEFRITSLFIRLSVFLTVSSSATVCWLPFRLWLFSC